MPTEELVKLFHARARRRCSILLFDIVFHPYLRLSIVLIRFSILLMDVQLPERFEEETDGIDQEAAQSGNMLNLFCVRLIFRAALELVIELMFISMLDFVYMHLELYVYWVD